MCQTVQEAVGAFFGSPPPSFSVLFGCVTLEKFYPAHNRMDKRRGLKLKFFKVSRLKRFCEERDSKS